MCNTDELPIEGTHMPPYIKSQVVYPRWIKEFFSPDVQKKGQAGVCPSVGTKGKPRKDFDEEILLAAAAGDGH